MEIDDGGVPLPNLDSISVSHHSETSSAVSSSSTTSEPPSYSAQPSVTGSDIDSETIPPIAAATQAIVMSPDSPGPPGALEQAYEDPTFVAGEFNSHPPSNLGEQANEVVTIEVDGGPPSELDSEDLEVLAFPSSESSSPASDGNDPNSTSPTSGSVSDHEDANLLHIFQQYLPIMHNHDLDQFLRLWRELWLHRKTEYPCISDEGGSLDIRHRHGKVSVKSMEKAGCDIQGITWSHHQTNSSAAREMRRMTSRNFINMAEINHEPPLEFYATRDFKACFSSESNPPLSNTDHFFRFRETNLKHVPEFRHNQLRHCLSADSKNAVFFYSCAAPNYPGYPYAPCLPTVWCYNPEADSAREAIDLRQRQGSDFFRLLDISCVNASDDVLIVGALREGHYAIKSLSNTCDDSFAQGIFKDSGEGAGINHVHTFPNRHNGAPNAVFCDNDAFIRVIDCNTLQQVHAQQWRSLVNCSATSPDGRLRIHVSDDPWPVVAEAETGRIIATLPDHKDHGFACDWSSDGISMATGHQDGIVQVWDARKMNRAVHVLPAEMGGVRSLHFSPLGSGHPVLVMAEPIDYVSIVDARTFQSKQDIEFFGEIAGVSMPQDGDALFIGNADPTYGGIMEFERTGYNGKFKHSRLHCSSLEQRKDQKRQAVYNAPPDNSDREDEEEERTSPEAQLKRKWKLDDQDARIWRTREHDWAADADINSNRHTPTALSRKQRWHRHLGLEEMIF